MNTEQQNQLPQKAIDRALKDRAIALKIRDRLVELRGMASAFNMLNENTTNSKEEILAAKETGKEIELRIGYLLTQYFNTEK